MGGEVFMSRTIINFACDASGDVKFFLERALIRRHDARVLVSLTLHPSQRMFARLRKGILKPKRVRAAGRHLLLGLSIHNAVGAAIQDLLQRPAASQPKANSGPWPIFLRIDSRRAERLPWESLFDAGPNAGRFLALRRSWPIGRIMGSSDAGDQIERTFDPPVRLLAVLAAAGQDARPEWDALYAAATQARFDLKIEVLLCDDLLKTHIDGLKDPNVKTYYLKEKALQPDERTLPDALAGMPHFLHFFCHGSSGRAAELHLADPLTCKSTSSIGPIRWDSQALLDEINALAEGPWMAVLNCCDGAKAAGNAGSMARSMVEDGIPGVVGMSEAFKTSDAHEFCAAFYTRAFREVEAAFLAGDGRATIEWIKAMLTPRTRILERQKQNTATPLDSSECKAWAIPILYVRPESFAIRRTRPNVANASAAANQVQELIQNLSSFGRVPDRVIQLVQEVADRIEPLIAPAS
jgi:CHAT domain